MNMMYVDFRRHCAELELREGMIPVYDASDLLDTPASANDKAGPLHWVGNTTPDIGAWKSIRVMLEAGELGNFGEVDFTLNEVSRVQVQGEKSFEILVVSYSVEPRE